MLQRLLVLLVVATTITFITYSVAIYRTVDIEMAIRRLSVRYFSQQVRFEITFCVVYFVFSTTANG